MFAENPNNTVKREIKARQVGIREDAVDRQLKMNLKWVMSIEEIDNLAKSAEPHKNTEVRKVETEK